MKNKCILILLAMALTACSTAKKIALGNESTIQLPKNAKKLNLQEFKAVNEKFEFPIPETALDNKFIADNVLISFHNVRNMAPNEESFEQRMKGAAIFNASITGHRVSGMQLMNINNNQVLISRMEGNKQISTSFFCKNATNKLATNGIVEADLSDSTKVDKTVDFIVKHVNFGN